MCKRSNSEVKINSVQRIMILSGSMDPLRKEISTLQYEALKNFEIMSSLFQQ